MLLIRLEPGGGAAQVQTYECPKCGKSKIIETADPMKKHAGGWPGATCSGRSNFIG
jgi:predicted RNA-binding Zn-ribbon protein involved in translation (DUF1610 family)